MSHPTLLTGAIIFLILPSVAYGGYFLLAILRRSKMGASLSQYPYSQRLFRAGHAHAGVWLVLALVALSFIDHSGLSSSLKPLLRYGSPLAALFTSGGFFAAGFPLDPNRNKPSRGIVLVYVGA